MAASSTCAASGLYGDTRLAESCGTVADPLRDVAKLKPAERYAPLEKVLRAYGLQDPYVPGGLNIEELLDDPKTNLRLLFFLLQTTIELVQIKERLSRS